MSVFQAYGSSDDVEIGYISGVATSWNNVSNVITNGSYINAATATNFKVRADSNGGTGTYALARIFMYFNTSALPDGAIITSASLDVFMESNVSGADTKVQPVSMVVGTFAAGALSTTDYGNLNKSQVYGSGAISVNASNNTINFNPSGFQYINKLGYTKIVLCPAADISGATPGTGLTERSKTLSSQNNITIGQRPLLTINYTLANPMASYVT